MVFNILKYSIESNNPIDFSTHYVALKEISDCKFLKSYTSETRVETSFLILTILSYLMPKRRDLIKTLQDILIVNTKYFMDACDLIKARFCLFWGYFADALFLSPDLKEFFNKYMVLVVNCLTMMKDDPDKTSVSFQAMDTLGSVINDSDSVIRISPLIKELFPYLFSLLGVFEGFKYIELIQEIVKYYSIHLIDYPEICAQLFNEIVNTILKLVEKKKENQGKTSVLIIKFWNLLRTISESKYLIPKHLDNFEKAISPLIEMIKNKGYNGVSASMVAEEVCNVINELIYGELFN